MEEVLKAIYAAKNADRLKNSQLVKVFTRYEFDASDYELLVYEETWTEKLGKWLGFSE